MSPLSGPVSQCRVTPGPSHLQAVCRVDCGVPHDAPQCSFTCTFLGLRSSTSSIKDTLFNGLCTNQSQGILGGSPISTLTSRHVRHEREPYSQGMAENVPKDVWLRPESYTVPFTAVWGLEVILGSRLPYLEYKCNTIDCVTEVTFVMSPDRLWHTVAGSSACGSGVTAVEHFFISRFPWTL